MFSFSSLHQSFLHRLEKKKAHCRNCSNSSMISAWFSCSLSAHLGQNIGLLGPGLLALVSFRHFSNCLLNCRRRRWKCLLYWFNFLFVLFWNKLLEKMTNKVKNWLHIIFLNIYKSYYIMQDRSSSWIYSIMHDISSCTNKNDA